MPLDLHTTAPPPHPDGPGAAPRIRTVAGPRAHGTAALCALSIFTLLAPWLTACGDPGDAIPRHMTLAAAMETGGRVPTASADAKDKARQKEYRVKAALLLNFIKYARIPKSAFPSDKAPIVVLVVGEDPFGPLLDKALSKKKLRGRKIVVKRSKTVPKSLDAHLVFAGKLTDKERKSLIKLSQKKPCILVGETPGFAEEGGFINLYLKKGKVKFEVNIERQKDTRVQLKAELLKLARIVKPSKAVGAPPR